MSRTNRPIASLSLDLDNKWSYLKTHGDPGWETYPSYLDVVVPRVLQFLDERKLKITFFVVGQDALLEKNRESIRSIAQAGHEIGNHSFCHEPWIDRYGREELENEIRMAEEAILQATGERVRGFRGPGYALSADMLEILKRRGYRYDASTFPTFLGPLARAYYFYRSRLNREEKGKRDALFGSVRHGLRPIKQYRWSLQDGSLVEVPVTTMPVTRLPIHLSYLIYIARFSILAAKIYFKCALRLCHWAGVQPSLLLHPLDFLGCEDAPELAFFPGMDLPSFTKIEWCGGFIAEYCSRFEVVPLLRHVELIEANGQLSVREPRKTLSSQ